MCKQKPFSLFRFLPTMAAVLAACASTSTTASMVFEVTQSTWGNSTQENSMAWAVDQANSIAGRDTIRMKPDLQINVDLAPVADGTSHWLARFTESVTIEGNNATLVNNPTYVTTGGEIATKTNIIGSAYDNPIAMPLS